MQSAKNILDRPLLCKQTMPALETETNARDELCVISDPAMKTRAKTDAEHLETCTPSTAASRAFSEVSVAPRPRLAPIMSSNSGSGSASGTLRRASSTACVSDQPQSPITAATVTVAAGVNTHAALQTRFMPGVGWCVRHAPGGGRYRIMFLDGAALEVDVDAECIEYAIADGEPMRWVYFLSRDIIHMHDVELVIDCCA